MNLDNGLRGVTRLGIDTAPLIYLIENDPRNDALVLNAIQRITSGQIVGITSVITLSEVLVRPFLAGDAVLQQRYRDILLHSAGFRTCSIDSAAAERAADLRARYGLRLPDAIQIAIALAERCEAFLTNDRRLARVTELRVLLLDDLEL